MKESAVLFVALLFVCIVFTIMYAHMATRYLSEKRRRLALEALQRATPDPAGVVQVWIDRYNQAVKDHKTSHDAADRFLRERNQLQNALDRIEHAAKAVVPDEDPDLMRALEAEDALRRHYDSER